MIVHLGLGAFHRAHQAVYTQDTGWEICGVAYRRRTVADALRAHDWRYTVISRGPETDEAREIGQNALKRALGEHTLRHRIEEIVHELDRRFGVR